MYACSSFAEDIKILLQYHPENKKTVPIYTKRTKEVNLDVHVHLLLFIRLCFENTIEKFCDIGIKLWQQKRDMTFQCYKSFNMKKETFSYNWAYK